MNTSTTEPAHSAGHLALEHFIPYRLSLLGNLISNAIARDYDRKFGMKVVEWRVMAVLARFGPASATSLCERIAMDKVSVSRATSGLESRGLVTGRTDADDRRKTVFELTEEGIDIHAQIVPIALAHEANLLSGLSAEELAQLDSLLRKLHENTGIAPAICSVPGSAQNR